MPKEGEQPELPPDPGAEASDPAVPGQNLLEQDIENIKAKVRAGKPLSAEERRRLEQVAGPSSGDPKSILEPVWLRNQSMLAKELGVDRRTIARWLKEEKNPGREADGRYNLTAWRLWVQENDKHAGRSVPPGVAAEDPKKAAELKMLLLKNERQEIDNAVKRGELMSIEEVCEVLTTMTAEFAQSVRNIKHHVASQVVGLPVGEAAKRIGREAEETLKRLALGEWAKKKVFWSSVSEHQSALQTRYSLGVGPSDT